MAFDPKPHLIKLKGKDYLEVSWRILWFRDDYPQGIITTEMVSYNGDEAVFKSRVETGDGGAAEGYGSETANDFGDFLEKASTKSIGRALGALGYGTQFATEYDFGAEAGKVVDAPVTPIRKTSGIERVADAPGADVEEIDDQATVDERIATSIRELAKQKIAAGRIDAAGLKDLLWKSAGVENVNDLLMQDVDDFTYKLEQL